MRRWLRLGLFGVGTLALLMVLVAALFVMTFDPNTQKDRIVDAVRRATGRELVLAGPLKLSLGWVPLLEAEDAALSNSAGGSRPQMATVARLEASIALMPLLSGHVEIESVTLDRPDILLEMDSQGVGNWQFRRSVAVSTDAPAAVTNKPSGPRPGTVVAVHKLVVLNGRVTWRNEATGRATVVDVARATLTMNRAEIGLVADAMTGGQAAHLDAIMVADGPGPWPIKLAADAAGAHVALDGAVLLPITASSYRGRVTATVPDLAALGALLKLPDLPPLHDARLDLAMADGLPRNMALHLGKSDLGAYAQGAMLNQLDLTLPGLGEAGRVTAEGSVPGGPWQLKAGLLVNRQTVALRALGLTTPGGDLAGDVAISQGERWALRGTLVSQMLDVDWLRQLRPAPVPASSAAPVPGAAPPPPVSGPSHVLSESPLPWNALRQADADLQVSFGTLRIGGAEYRALTGHLSLLDGALRLDPFAVEAPEGRVEGSLVADASLPEPSVAVKIRSAAFALDPLLQAAGLPGGSDAPVEIDVALSSAGASWQALASRLDGHVGLAMVDGTISNASLAAALGGLVPKGAGRLEQGGRSAVRCLAVRLDAKAGQVTLNALDLDTNRLDLTGDGTINLADETMALRLRPTIRVGGTGILAPVRLDGGLARPAASLDSQGVEGRAGLVIGGAAPPDGCPAALTAARDGRSGRLPAPAVVKPPKASDLLRSFLR